MKNQPESADRLVFLNGRILLARHATLSVMDRGFLYGDGLFETLLVLAGEPVLWAAHWQRLATSLAAFKLAIPYGPMDLLAVARDLVRENGCKTAILRMDVSRGPGPRGYSPKGATTPTVLLQVFPETPARLGRLRAWRLALATCRLPVAEWSARHKSTSRATYVMARAEADAAGADDALLTDAREELLECTSANLFWLWGRRLCTPAVGEGPVLAGIARSVLLQLAAERGLAVEEVQAPVAALREAEGVFLTLSTRGVVEVSHLDGQPLRRSPWVPLLHAGLWERFRAEVRRQKRDWPATPADRPGR
jgi:branched-chain amino acid aminotransferase